MTDSPPQWKLYTGSGTEQGSRANRNNGRLNHLPEPPLWRRPGTLTQHRGATYKPGPHEIDMINVAMVLRRPLLVTGRPGSGKSSLPYAVARELGLGEVLRWSVNSRSTLRDGLYLYDAVSRLRDITILNQMSKEDAKSERARTRPDEVGRYIRLGPLGTAMARSKDRSPRVLLIDEIDKADLDFPNDLLHVLEEAEFAIEELQRLAAPDDATPNELPTVEVRTADKGWFSVEGGSIKAEDFPFIVITSNGERDLPPAFLRRCIRLKMSPPDDTRLKEILAQHIGADAMGSHADTLDPLIESFAKDLERNKLLAIDQLMNAAWMVVHGDRPNDADRKRLVTDLLRELDQA